MSDARVLIGVAGRASAHSIELTSRRFVAARGILDQRTGAGRRASREPLGKLVTGLIADLRRAAPRRSPIVAAGAGQFETEISRSSGGGARRVHRVAERRGVFTVHPTDSRLAPNR